MLRWLSLMTVLAACADDSPLPRLRGGTACPADVMRGVNDHWIALHSDPGDAKWELATYYIGDLAAADALQEPAYLEYAVRWAEHHQYEINGDTTTRNADNHAAGQVYLELYERMGDSTRIADIVASLDNVIRSGERGDWSWIDAQFMASPAFAHLGELTQEARYHGAMFELYSDARDRRRLYDASEGLWFRDENYIYPHCQTPNGKKSFWSRGNGWVFASLARTLMHLPADSPYRPAYEEMLRAMATALAKVQRADGFWNVSLADPEHYPGPESSGTSFFTYGLAWGVNVGLLDRVEYTPVIERAWRGLASGAVRADGELGLVQGVGEAPGSSQPVTLRSRHSFGVGAFLLAGSEVMQLGVDFGCL
jgi:unsaturated rhamnogalacturonyl hydrolase